MTSNQVLRVAVFGASGNIGRHVVDQLLAAGHIVTAYVRNPAKLSTTVSRPGSANGDPRPRGTRSEKLWPSHRQVSTFNRRASELYV
jgi:putative NADH-flavin reductase